jgi:hypothetical protein
VGRACNQNGGTSLTKESLRKNKRLKETDRKTQKTMERWSETQYLPVSWHTNLKNRSERQRILEAKHRGGQGSIWAVIPLKQQQQQVKYVESDVQLHSPVVWVSPTVEP